MAVSSICGHVLCCTKEGLRIGRQGEMSHMVPVSIVIATYNRASILKNTIDHLIKQNPAPLEILVVDQSDSVPDEVRDYLTGLEGDGRIRWIRQHPPNAQAARNRGILEAKGEVLLFLDDDIECGPELVGVHWNNYEDPKIAGVSGMILEPGQFPTEELPARFYKKKIGWMFFPLNYGKRTECINLSSCNCSIRREIALAVRGFDENFIRTLFDDTDFSWRVHLKCLLAGLKTVHDPDARLTHLQVQTGGKRPGKVNECVVADAAKWDNLFYFHLKHLGFESLKVIAQRYRWWIWHKKNIIRPWWLLVAHAYFVVGLFRSLILISGGPKLIEGEGIYVTRSNQHSNTNI